MDQVTRWALGALCALLMATSAGAQELMVSAIFTPPQPEADGHPRQMVFVPARETGPPDWPAVSDYPLPFTTERYDKYGAWEGSTFTAPKDGWYSVSLSLTIRLLEPVTEPEKVTVFVHRNFIPSPDRPFPTNHDFPFGSWSVYLDAWNSEAILGGSPSLVPLQAGETLTVSLWNMKDVELDFWQFVTWLNVVRMD